MDNTFIEERRRQIVRDLSSDDVISLIEHEGLGEDVCNSFKGQSGKMLILLGNLNDEQAKFELKRRGLTELFQDAVIFNLLPIVRGEIEMPNLEPRSKKRHFEENMRYVIFFYLIIL